MVLNPSSSELFDSVVVLEEKEPLMLMTDNNINTHFDNVTSLDSNFSKIHSGIETVFLIFNLIFLQGFLAQSFSDPELDPY
jgi:hypothetical protein